MAAAIDSSSRLVHSAPGVCSVISRPRLRQGFGLCEQIGKPVEQRQPGKQADGGQTNQLHHQFQGDGGNHAAMVLVRVDPGGAEQHAERRQQQRRPEGHRALAAGAGLRRQNDQQARRHRLQLQRDIGQ